MDLRNHLWDSKSKERLLDHLYEFGHLKMDIEVLCVDLAFFDLCLELFLPLLVEDYLYLCCLPTLEVINYKIII